MKNKYQVEIQNEMFENVVAATGNQEQLERIERARNGEDKVTFYHGRPVKRCYPYGN